MIKRVFLLILSIALVLSLSPLSTLQAQDNTVTITVAIPTFATDSQGLVKEFEAKYPNIKIVLVQKDAQIPPPSAGLDAYFKAVQEYVSSADVVYLASSPSALMLTEATRAGYLLDMTPLVTADKNLNTDDFYPAVWKSYQWDHGIWALPFAADTTVLSYNMSAFDAAGIAYPDSKWSLDDFSNAAHKLAHKDATGTTITPSIFAPGSSVLGTLVQSVTGKPPFDSSTIPDTLQFTTPETEKVLDTVNQMEKDGLVATDFNAPIALLPAAIAARMGASSGGVFISAGNGGSTTVQNPTPSSSTKFGVTTLPGGGLGVETEGMGISAGTQHINEAYTVASFLTTRTELAGGLSSVTARKSLRDSTTSAIKRPDVSPEIKTLVDQALNSGITASDLRYSDYLQKALGNMKSENLDAHSALAAVEAQAIKDQNTAIAAKGKVSIVIAEPSSAQLPAGKITLNFGLLSNIRPMPHQAEWDQLAKDFAASDPQVGLVNVQLSNANDLATNASNYDCFELPFNAVPGAKTSSLIPLDSFFDTDKTFDKSDVISSVLSQLQQDGKTWALPLMIEPEMLSYDSQQFQKANVPEPQGGWTIAAFSDALKTLKVNAQTPFDPRSPGGTYLLMLIAAYGGLPLDFRTDPPTINFTDPATVTAIQQVLDLAKNGSIKYSALSGTGGFMIISGGGNGPAITTRKLIPFGAVRAVPNNPPDPYKNVTYPTGTTYSPVSYTIDTAYISAKAQNPEACYRWISMIAQHPELFTAMPARHSQIDATAALQGADMTAIYKQIEAQLNDPKSNTFPSLFQGGATPTGFLESV